MRKFSILFLGMVFAVGIMVVNSESNATEITYWTFLDPASDNVRSAAQNKQIARFQEINPDINVKVEVVHWSKQVDMYIQATGAGKGPDVALVHTLRVPQVAAAKCIEPLNEYAKSFTELEKEDFMVPFEEQYTDGILWNLHLEYRAPIVFYRKDLFKQEGLSVPTSWEELIAAGKKLTKGRMHGLIWPLSHKDAAAGWQYSIGLYYSRGSSIVDSKGKATFNNDVGQQFFQMLVDMVKKDEIMPPSPVSTEDGRSAYKAGVTAMFLDGTHVFGTLSAAHPETGTFPLPSLGAAEPAPVFPTGQTLTLGINSKAKDAAWKFIKFMVSPEAQLINAKIANQLSTRKSVLKDPWFEEEKGALLLGWGNYLAKYGKGFSIPEHYVFLMDSMAKAYEQILVGGQPVTEALTDAAERYNQRAGF